jgi:hypothetical protein
MSDGVKNKAGGLGSVPRVYEVGYASPPKETRFKPGQSGNPRGRPRGSKNKSQPPGLHEERLKAILMDEAYRTITVNDGPRQVSVPMAQAVVRSLALNAVKGNQRAQRLFTELVGSVERENRRLHDEWLDVATTYKIEWDRELERRKRLGITGPEPLPHPDNVLINYRTGQVEIRGPMTKEEKAELDLWTSRKADFEAEKQELERELSGKIRPKMKAVYEEELRQTERVLEVIRRVVPD